MYFRHLPCSLPSATEFLVTKWSHWNPSLTLQRKGRVRCIFLWTLMVLSWIVSVHKLHRRVCPSCHNYRGFSAKKNMFLPDIIKDNSDSLEKTRGLDYMGLFMLLLKLSLCSACSSKIISPASIQPAAARLFRRLQLTVICVIFHPCTFLLYTCTVSIAVKPV